MAVIDFAEMERSFCMDRNAWYDEECKGLCSILSGINARISHIGSTAIDNIWAKPIIDILVEIPLADDISKVKGLIVQNGYTRIGTFALNCHTEPTNDGPEQKSGSSGLFSSVLIK